MRDGMLRTATERVMPRQDEARFNIPATSVNRIEADGVQVFYRAAGDGNAPVVLLLHGFPTSSFMFRELIPRLASDYRVIAPDLPGFGFTEVPPERQYPYSFDQLAFTIDAFTQALKIDRYAIYVFDYGAPTGFRLAMAHPDADHRDCFAEWERLRRRPWRCLGPDPKVLGCTHGRKQGHTSPKYSDRGRNALAVHPRRGESGDCSA